MIVIIDYGVGNLGSIRNMLNRIGVEGVISGEKEEIWRAEKLILPGVGSFDYGMQQLRKAGLVDMLNERVLDSGVPLLGICLGAQLLTQSSEEGKESGLGWVDGKTIAFDKSKFKGNQKVPHMNWEYIKGFSKSRLFTDMDAASRFYFVHSYHLQLNNEEDILATAEYGYEFTVGIEHKNILGVQFHPEKSHIYGMKLLDNFVRYY